MVKQLLLAVLATVHITVILQNVDGRRKAASKTSTLHMGRTVFKLLNELASKISWESAFEDVGVHQCWSHFKRHFFNSAGAGDPKVLEVKQAGQKAGLAGQGSSIRT